MESGRSLARVISEMQREIRKLESENTALRGRLGETSAACESSSDASAHANLRRNVSAPLLDGQYKENMMMTVRRYSISSGRSEGGSGSKWVKLHEGFHVEKFTSRHSLQQYVANNRSKVKRVTFLLPVDDIYTSRPVMAEQQAERTNHETDS